MVFIDGVVGHGGRGVCGGFVREEGHLSGLLGGEDVPGVQKPVAQHHRAVVGKVRQAQAGETFKLREAIDAAAFHLRGGGRADHADGHEQGQKKRR